MLQTLATRTNPKARRDVALLRLLHDLGLRRAEAVGLDWEHLDLTGSRVSVLRKGKTQRLWLTLASGASSHPRHGGDDAPAPC